MYPALFMLLPVLAATPASNPATPAALAAQGGNRFGIDLYRRQAAGPGNLFFSPVSLEMALAMTHAGAAGQTAQQMRQVLRLGADAAAIDASFAALRNRLAEAGKGLEMSTANALWGQNQEPFKPEFLSRVERHYGAGLKRVDFARPAEAAGTINNWVSKETRGRIPTLIESGMLNAMTRLVLTNAIYFKGDWLNPFDKSMTREERFRIASGGVTQASMMTRTGGYRYFGDATLQALELPYAGSEIGMLVILPRRVDGLKALEQSLSIEAVGGWISKLELRQVEVHLPRFKMRWTTSSRSERCSRRWACPTRSTPGAPTSAR
jgi:serpin B